LLIRIECSRRLEKRGAVTTNRGFGKFGGSEMMIVYAEQHALREVRIEALRI
jgi:hypothetical protein